MSPSIIVAILLLLVVRSQAQLWSTYNGSEYRIVHTHYTWHQARDFCMERGADLASIHSQAELNWLVQQRALRQGDMWIGLNMINQAEWTWSDGTPLDFVAWDSGYPTYPTLPRHCAYILANGTRFQNYESSGEFMLVCKRPIGATGPKTDPPTPAVRGYCPTGYAATGNKCFKVFIPSAYVERANWAEARRICKEQPGLFPDLACINNEQENAAIQKQLKTYIEGAYWIGLYDRAYHDWTWADNSAYYDYTNWQLGRPSYDDCGVLQNTEGNVGTWKDLTCGSMRGYVCQTFKELVETSPAPTPSASHQDSATTDAELVETTTPAPTPSASRQDSVMTDAELVETTTPAPTPSASRQDSVTIDAELVETTTPAPTPSASRQDSVTTDAELVETTTPAPTPSASRQDSVTTDAELVEATTPAPTPSASHQDLVMTDAGLTSGVIAAIVLTMLILAIVCAGAVYYFRVYRRYGPYTVNEKVHIDHEFTNPTAMHLHECEKNSK